MSRRGAVLTWTLAALCVVAIATETAMAAALHFSETVTDTAPDDAIALGFPVIGALLATRGGSRLGVAMVVAGAGSAASTFASVYAPWSELSGWPGRSWVYWVAEWAWVPAVVLLCSVVFVHFPDGRLPAPGWRWRWVPVVGIGTGVVLLVGAMLAPYGPADDALLPNPLAGALGVTGPISPSFGAAFQALFLVQVAGAVASVAALAVRFRRGGEVARRQIALVLAALATFVVTLVVSAVVPDDVLPVGTVGYAVLKWVSRLAALGVPVAIGVAVSRYRLFEIDRLVSRTVSYALLSGIIAGLFAGVVLLVSQIGLGSSWAVAAATLLSLAALSPLRRWLQDRVDRRFHRARVDGVRTAERFAARLRDEVDLDAVRADLLATVTASMAPAGASVWLVRRP